MDTEQLGAGASPEDSCAEHSAISGCVGSTAKIRQTAFSTLGVGLCFDCEISDMELCQGALPDELAILLTKAADEIDADPNAVISVQKVVTKQELGSYEPDKDAASQAYGTQSRWVSHLDSNNLTDQFVRFPFRLATDDEMAAVHHEDYLDAMRETARNGPNKVDMKVPERTPPASCNYQRTKYTKGDGYQTCELRLCCACAVFVSCSCGLLGSVVGQGIVSIPCSQVHA